MIGIVALTLLANTAPPGQPQADSDAIVPYVLLAPGVGAMALVDPAFHSSAFTNEESRFRYQWGVRAGILRRFPRHLAMGFGGHLEHSFWNSTRTFHGFINGQDVNYHDTTHLLRVQLEYLPGLLVANERLFVHAVVGFGYMGEYPNERRDHGLAASPGLGLVGRVWRGLSLGVHVGADLGWTDDGGGGLAGNHAFDLAIEIGWLF
jgi:hypothetical protein